MWQAGATLHRSARASHYRGLSLWNTGSRRAGSVVVAHGPSCSAACGIFPVQGSNPCPLHWQAESQPLRHQGSPSDLFLFLIPFHFSEAFHNVDTPLPFDCPGTTYAWLCSCFAGHLPSIIAFNPCFSHFLHFWTASSFVFHPFLFRF